MVRRAPGATDARVYDISARVKTQLHATLSIGQKATEAQKRELRKHELEDDNTELIHDFAFPTVSHRVKVTRDGQHIFASGTYPPQIHVYDTENISLKFKRHLNHEIVDFQILEDDWRKFVLLTSDRYVDLHSPFGSHFRTRVPKFGRDLMLLRSTSDLFVCGLGPDVWRLNLDVGRFLAPLESRSGVDGGNNVCGVSPVTSLLAFGGDTGLLDVWDSRVLGKSARPAATLDVAAILCSSKYGQQQRPEITAVRFDDRDAVSMAVGVSSGQTLLFDLRSSVPVQTRDQGNGLPVHSVRLHEDGIHCLSADARGIKAWRRKDGVNSAIIEPDADVNHLCVIGGSGVMCAAVEAPRVRSFYVPMLGAAPKWCAFLDSFTEELEGGRGVEEHREDGQEQIYENYKFVTKAELEGLGLAHLVGTDVLKAYMHGYFIHSNLHRRAVQATEPFAYKEYRKQKAREKVEKARESRISKVRAAKKVRVNQRVVEDLRELSKTKKKGAQTGASLLGDERFKAMFENIDFKVDEESERFQFLNPSAAEDHKRRRAEEEESDEEYLEQFDLVDDGDGDQADGPQLPPADRIWSSGDESDDVPDSEADVSDGDIVEAQNDDGIRKGTSATSPATRDQSGEMRSGAKSQARHGPKMYEISKDGELARGDGSSGNSSAPFVRRHVKENMALGERLGVRRPKPQASFHGNRKRPLIRTKRR